MRPSSLTTIVALVSAAVVAAGPAPAHAAPAPCSRGDVALTFDDGPLPGRTPLVLDALRKRHTPGVFFVIGAHVERHPALLQRTRREGHRVGNHTWSHPDLRSLSDGAIRAELRRTNEVILRHGGKRPKLFRPPRFRSSSRVRRIAGELGLTEVGATVNPQDWVRGQSAAVIADRTLRGLHRGAVVVLHDGNPNVVNTAAALPRIIDGARARGYCFGTLNSAGRVAPATPRIRIADAEVREGPPGTTTTMAFLVTLSVPTSRAVSVRWATANGSATAGRDYKAASGTVRFKPGSRSARVRVEVLGDASPEPNETVTLRLSHPEGGALSGPTATGRILDDD